MDDPGLEEQMDASTKLTFGYSVTEFSIDIELNLFQVRLKEWRLTWMPWINEWCSYSLLSMGTNLEERLLELRQRIQSNK